MPGTPDPVLGSDAATLALAAAVGALAAALPVALRDRLPAPGRLAVGGGFAYGLLCLSAWTGARLVTDSFVVSPVDRPGAFVALAAGGAVVLGAQAAVPLYVYARWRLRTPLAGLFGATTLALYAFLRVRGESDPLALYALFFGPMVVAALCALALAEAGVGRLVARALSRRGP